MENGPEAQGVLKRTFVIRCSLRRGVTTQVEGSKLPEFLQQRVVESIEKGCHDYSFTTTACHCGDSTPHQISIILEDNLGRPTQLNQR